MIHTEVFLTAFRETVESGVGFSKNEVTRPFSSTSRIPHLVVSYNGLILNNISVTYLRHYIYNM